MSKLTNFIDRLYLDNKYVSMLASAVATWALAKYAGGLDANISAALVGLVTAGIGYRVPNDGTVLRRNQESGNPDVPEELKET